MKSLTLPALVLFAGLLNTATAYEPCGCNPVESWATYSNNCSAHLWDGYCCERHSLGCGRGCGCETGCNSGCDCLGNSSTVPAPFEAVPLKPADVVPSKAVGFRK